MLARPSFLMWMALVLITCGPTEDPRPKNTLIKLNDFPEILRENSGMTEYGDLLWIINDGGNEPAVFGFNKLTGIVDKKLIVRNAVNTDWEEITQDDRHLYIGDFGNNAGDRHDLRIYIIDKAALQNAADTIPFSGLITFAYQDQTQFIPDNMNTPFDCEAFAVMGDSVVLFTKDWLSGQTSLYTLPARSGEYKAVLRVKFNISGLVTASAWSDERKELLLLGYRDYVPFIQVVSNFSLDNPVFSNSRRVDFNDFAGAQTEGIAYSKDKSVYVSCELSPFVTQSLFRAQF